MLEKAIELSPREFDLYARVCPPWIRPEDHVHYSPGCARRLAGLTLTHRLPLVNEAAAELFRGRAPTRWSSN